MMQMQFESPHSLTEGECEQLLEILGWDESTFASMAIWTGLSGGQKYDYREFIKSGGPQVPMGEVGFVWKSGTHVDQIHSQCHRFFKTAVIFVQTGTWWCVRDRSLDYCQKKFGWSVSNYGNESGIGHKPLHSQDLVSKILADEKKVIVIDQLENGERPARKIVEIYLP